MSKNAIVTGSSRGIGAAVARALAENGYGVCINYIERQDKAEELVNELRAKGRRAVAVRADVADAGEVNRMFGIAQSELGEIGVLVNNAGISCHMQFQDTDAATWKRVMDVNLGGCYNCIQAALPSMLHEHQGIIVNMASIWGLHGGSCESAYTASKHAVVGLTRALSAELAPSFIRVNAVAPGVIKTDMMAQELDAEQLQELMLEMPMERFGRPEDVAQTVMYLVNSEYITGEVIKIDGGFLI